ncbi:unnamed protein product, partial [Symbiodinium microadriaticum]
ESSDVKALKQRLHAELGLPARFRQRLVHEGNELDDAFQLDSAMELQVLTLAFSDDAQQMSDLYRAATYGWVVEAEALLQLPMDPDGDAASYDGTTPLMHAANTSQVDVVRLFIEAGAQLNYCSTRTGRTVLMQAAWLGYSEVVEVFLEAGARMDICDSDDRTALHISAEAAHASIVQLLLAAGADRDVQDHDGRTALMLATEGYHAEVRRLLEGHPVP